MNIQKPFDQKCLELADYFLPGANSDTRSNLAAAIQETVEEFEVPGELGPQAPRRGRLTREQRTALAKKAAAARWKGKK